MYALPRSFRDNLGLWLLAAIGMALALGLAVRLLGFLPAPAPPAPAEAPHATAAGAWGVCQQFVSARLVAPATAKFPGQSAAIVTAETPLRWMVAGYVDSQNEHGALVRSDWACEVRWDGGSEWTLLGVTIK